MDRSLFPLKASNPPGTMGKRAGSGTPPSGSKVAKTESLTGPWSSKLLASAQRLSQIQSKDLIYTL